MVKMTVIDKIVGSALDMISIGFVSGETYLDSKGQKNVVDVIYYKDAVGRLLHSRCVKANNYTITSIIRGDKNISLKAFGYEKEIYHA